MKMWRWLIKWQRWIDSRSHFSLVSIYMLFSKLLNGMLSRCGTDWRRIRRLAKCFRETCSLERSSRKKFGTLRSWEGAWVSEIFHITIVLHKTRMKMLQTKLHIKPRLCTFNLTQKGNVCRRQNWTDIYYVRMTTTYIDFESVERKWGNAKRRRSLIHFSLCHRSNVVTLSLP